MHLLFVEDELKVAEAVRSGLESENISVTLSHRGDDALAKARSTVFDIILLDVMLPGCDGFSVLRQLRAEGNQAPVLLLTARDALDDRVTGLNLGADDYLVKPFAFPELLARVRALLRRGRLEQTLVLRAGDLSMDLVSRQVRRGERRIELTTREFELLEYLLRHKNQLVSREMLARDVWRQNGRATSLDNVIDVHIARLRKKIDPEDAVKLIQTVRGVGFSISGEKC